MAEGEARPGERRRIERRVNARVADLTLPEFRRILITTILFVVVLALFLWMVRTVIIAAFLGVVAASYLRPIHRHLTSLAGDPRFAAGLTLLLMLVPLLGLLVYSYVELLDAARYVSANEEFIAGRIDTALRGVPFFQDRVPTDTIRRWVLTASSYGAALPAVLRDAVVGFSIGATIFLFTAFYVLIDGDQIARYVREKVPPRYTELSAALESNVRGVLYGAVFATLVTQLLKTAVLFALLLLFDVPLAAVLAVLAFVIGFFPVVGSWSVYVPVAGWLVIFRDAVGPAIVVLGVGFIVNTLFISTWLRPRLAAQRSRVLNFYWMLVGLVTGVYTFGIAGILLGPILIGMLKAIIDTLTSAANWRLVEAEDAPETETAAAPRVHA
ncbi:MAG TPA: AI-2E family transporter [Gemmatimonadaceae bacterium]|nr:AI-2E family transporter [Gemmatimonadaceae bacterium]